MNKNFAVIGAGAIGGYYGACLQKAGADVHFLLHSDYEHVRIHGLKIESKNGDFDLPAVQAYDRPADMPRCDVILVALKSIHNDILPEVLPHVVTQGSEVVALQNGVGVERFIAGIPGVQHVIGGLCFICSSKLGPGHIRHLDYGEVTFGEYTGDGSPAGITPRMEWLKEAFTVAGNPVRLAEDLITARWKKLFWNIPFSGLNVVLNASTKTIISNPSMRALSVALMKELQRASSVCARPIPDAFIEEMIDRTEKMKPYKASMKLDYDHGRPMEVESMYGVPIQLARERGVEMPKTEMLYQLLKYFDEQNARPAED